MNDLYSWINEAYAPWTVQLAVVFGLLVGSFLNVVIYRIPVMMEREWTVFAKTHLNIALTNEEKEPFSLTKPASRCPKCGSSVKPWQNIPVLSYILLKGQCHKCHVHISLRYPLIEILTACIFGIVAVCYGWSWIALAGFIFSAILIALTFIDADTQYLPDELTNPLIWLGLLANSTGNGLVDLKQSLLGAVFGYLSLWLLNKIHKTIRGIDGIGGGDFKLLAALGAWLGSLVLPIIVLVAAIISILAAVVMKVAKSQPIAFGPSLAIAGWVVFIAYDKVIAGVNWWLHQSGLA